MTYDTGKRILKVGDYEKVRLSKLEHKMLICLSSENVATYEEISNYIYGNYNEHTYAIIHSMLLRLRKKTKMELDIETVREVGLKLKNEIYFK